MEILQTMRYYLYMIDTLFIYNLLIALAIFAFWLLRKVFTNLIFKYLLSFAQKQNPTWIIF